MGQSVRGSATSTGGLRGLPAPARRPPHPFAILNPSCRAVFCARAKRRGVRASLLLNIWATPRPGAAPQKSCHCAAMRPGKTARSAEEPIRHCCLPGLIVKSLNQRFHPDERAGRITLSPKPVTSTYLGGCQPQRGVYYSTPLGQVTQQRGSAARITRSRRRQEGTPHPHCRAILAARCIRASSARSSRASSRRRCPCPPLKALRDERALPSLVRGPVLCCHGCHWRINSACRCRRCGVQVVAMLVLQ